MIIDNEKRVFQVITQLTSGKKHCARFSALLSRLVLTLLAGYACLILGVGTAQADGKNAHGIDTSLFFENALIEQPVIEECTLSDGTKTSCYKLIIAGSPANHDIYKSVLHL